MLNVINPMNSVYVEFGAHISATFISANTTWRRQSQRLFNSAPSNTALTHFGDLHFSEHNSPRHTFVRRFPYTSIFSSRNVNPSMMNRSAPLLLFTNSRDIIANNWVTITITYKLHVSLLITKCVLSWISKQVILMRSQPLWTPPIG